MTHFRHHLCKPFHSNCSIEDRSTRKERTTLNDNCTGSFKKEANSNLSWFLVFSLSLLGYRPLLLGRRRLLLGWRPSLLGWRRLLSGSLFLSFFLPPSLSVSVSVSLSLSLRLSLSLSLSRLFLFVLADLPRSRALSSAAAPRRRRAPRGSPCRRCPRRGLRSGRECPAHILRDVKHKERHLGARFGGRQQKATMLGLSDFCCRHTLEFKTLRRFCRMLQIEREKLNTWEKISKSLDHQV